MRKESEEHKQDASEEGGAEDVKRDGFSANELGGESAYDGTTEIEQRMRRGDETKGDPNERDVVGAPHAAIETDSQPVPRRRNAKSGSGKIKVII